jgi:hypothetical protein
MWRPHKIEVLHRSTGWLGARPACPVATHDEAAQSGLIVDHSTLYLSDAMMLYAVEFFIRDLGLSRCLGGRPPE